MIVKLCNADQLPPPGGMTSFAGRGGLQICVASLPADGAQDLVAFENRCPHQNAPLSTGHLEGCHVVCPYHGWRYDTRTGAGDHPSDPGLQCYEIRRYGSEVFLRLPDAAG